ncbi:MAG: trypsin-like peptidase domain-containing protein [Ktedonobacteraceae bacterium]|nr:trypsin-like peptidase domain-containing protein [Ktedonobacteraceae bacterium]
MTQTTEYTPTSSFPLPDAFSAALTGIFERVRPSVVQIHAEGRGGGTGIIWHEDGRILTNNHVVARDDARVQVLLSDGRTLTARVLQRNRQLDLALLKADGADLQPLPAGDSTQLRVGEWVFALGHPWGQRWVLTAGIVSTISTVKLAENASTRYIKSDVGLAPGNSGGPLLDADGNFIGINAMIFGGDLSVSIPSEVVNRWLAELPQNKRRISLGVEIQAVDLPTNVRQELTPVREKGLLIVGLRARQEQFKDLLIGDTLLDVASKPVSDAATLRNILAQGKEDAPVDMKILRGGTVISLVVATQITELAA